MRPLYDKVIVRRDEAKEVLTSSGLVATVEKEPPAEGTVISVGQGRFSDNGVRIPLDVTKGEHVVFGKYSGTETKVDGETLLILSAEEILAVK